MFADRLMGTMRPASTVLTIALALVVTTITERTVCAQTVFESAGERALGMGGAFVAVADDATAAHWNPAGLATSGLAGMTIGLHRFQIGNPDDDLRSGAGRRKVSLTSLGTLPIGVSFGTFRDTVIATTPSDELRTETFKVGQLGVSLLQTVLPGLVVGGTAKILRGGIASAIVSDGTIDQALEVGEDLDVDQSTGFDLDLAAMASSDLIRVGFTMKNLRSSSFGEIPGIVRSMPRQARLGFAVLPAGGVTLAMDVDLNTVDLVGGLRRMGAAGGEALLGSHLGIRAGVRWSLVGSKRPVTSVGTSVAVRRGMWIDAHYAKGRQDEEREFGVALRAGL